MTPKVLELLQKSGWYAGRAFGKVDCMPEGVMAFPKAIAILTEFGGLTLGDRNEYTVIGRLDDPEVLRDLQFYSQLTKKRLFPLGYRVHQDREYIFVDEEGVIYMLADALRVYAISFDDALRQIASFDQDAEVEKRLQERGLSGLSWPLRDES